MSIRPQQHTLRHVMTLAALLLLGLIIMFSVPGKAFAADDEASHQERHIWFNYGYIECTGMIHPLSKDDISYDKSLDMPQDFSVSMMLCDTGHIVQVEGDGVTAGNVTLTSTNPSVLDIDNDGNVTLKKEGSARIKATVAADSVYDERTVYLDVKTGRHDPWIGPSTNFYYVDRPQSWLLDLDVSDGSHQICIPLRPGAKITRYWSSDVSVAYVDQNGFVTPVSAGKTMINVEIDDGGGRYKSCGLADFITVTGDCGLRDQEIAGDTGNFIIDWHDGLQLDLHAETKLEYSVAGSGGDYVSVDANGFVEFTQKGYATIRVIAPPNEEFRPAEVIIYIQAEEEAPEQPAKRHAWFTYGYNGSDGTMHPCSDEEVRPSGSGSNNYPSSFAVNMAMSDTDHVVHVAGDGLSENDVTLTSHDPDVLEIDSAGNVTLNKTGSARITAVIPADDTYAERTLTLTVRVTDAADVPRAKQEITGSLGPHTIDWHDGIALDLHAKTDLQYSIYGQSTGSPSVDSNGVVTFRGKGSASVKVVAVESEKYESAEAIIKITARDYAEEKAAEEADAREKAREAALKKEIARTKSHNRMADKARARNEKNAAAKPLKCPSFKVKALNGHRNKLTWGKVANADGYIVYIKYPGSKKYAKAVTRDKTVKSVVHRGLSKGKVYCYKVRAYKKVKGKTVYGKYSKVRKVRAK